MGIKIKFDIDLMKFISLFEKITKVNAKDCFKQHEKIVFIVPEGKAGIAVGKKGMNIKKLEGILKKKVKIVEYSDDLIEFVKNVIHPLGAKEITEDDGIVTIIPPDSQTRGYLIGREAINLRGFEDIVKRYFDIKEIKVV
ncbi:NusA-like transcription termination signal-binding factor [Candidatus Woesearchaeota archaeon]|nr:NusA-like transcription termination signal-binding factor [Candidatus Woesearchaeota archaeon]